MMVITFLHIESGSEASLVKQTTTDRISVPAYKSTVVIDRVSYIVHNIEHNYDTGIIVIGLMKL